MSSESHIPTLKRGGISNKSGAFVERQKKELFDGNGDIQNRLKSENLGNYQSDLDGDITSEEPNRSLQGSRTVGRNVVENDSVTKGDDLNLLLNDSSAEDIDNSDDDSYTCSSHQSSKNQVEAVDLSRNQENVISRKNVANDKYDVENEYEYVIVNSRVRLKEAELKRNLALADSSFERDRSSLKRGASTGVLIRANREMSAGRVTPVRPQSSERQAVANTSSKHGPVPTRSSPRSSHPSGHLPQRGGAIRSSKSVRQSPRLSQSPSPRNGQVSNENCKDEDISLKLSLKGLNDSDDEDDTLDDDEESSSPRKGRAVSPRKGVMLTTKSFEAKTSLMRRNESDSSIARPSMRSPSVSEQTLSSNKKPFLKKSLSNREFSIQLSRNSTLNEDLLRLGASVENTGQPVLRRTSSGRKLPGVPIDKINKPLQKSNSNTNIDNSLSKKPDPSIMHVESDSSFLSISKDGSTEYVSLDFNDSSGSSVKTSTNKDVVSSPDNSLSGDGDTKDVKSKVPLEKRPPIAEHPQTRGHPSPRDTKAGKPPIERKSSKGTIEKSVPASPRSNVLASPRKTVIAASPRGIPSPRTHNSPRGPQSSSPRRVQSASPRTIGRSSQPSPKDNTLNKGIRNEKHSNTDMDKVHENPNTVNRTNGTCKLNADSASIGQSVDTQVSPTRKSKHHSGSSIMSPRPGSPAKRVRQNSSSDLRNVQITEEPSPRTLVHLRQDGCQSLDLQQVIDIFGVGKEAATDKVGLCQFFLNLLIHDQTHNFRISGIYVNNSDFVHADLDEMSQMS